MTACAVLRRQQLRGAGEVLLLVGAHGADLPVQPGRQVDGGDLAELAPEVRDGPPRRSRLRVRDVPRESAAARGGVGPHGVVRHVGVLQVACAASSRSTAACASCTRLRPVNASVVTAACRTTATRPTATRRRRG